MPNRLADSASLYLQKHAHNPIEWWPWCEEALTKARQEDKPILLSIGYSSCHWCTVMEGEAFSDAEIATYLNQKFLPIKVDREERPDLDSIYMQALQMMVGQGGWPLNIFLDPQDLLPFYGGTYFPLQARYGRPGFLQVLQVLRQTYDSDKERLREIRQEILQNLQENATARQGGQDLSEGLLLKGLEYSTSIIGPNFGGNSFPMMPYAQTALRLVRFGGERAEESQRVCEQRGWDLVLGGILDQVGGGFHRYTVDATWTVPHFEKMLYDNGQILEYLANLWGQGCRDQSLREAVARTVAWLQREMLAPEGYFYASQDADSFEGPESAEPEEGAFYCWSYGELQSILTMAELEALSQTFTVSPGGNFGGANVLQRRQRQALSALSRSALAKLFQGRYGLPEAQIDRVAPARNNAEAKAYWTVKTPDEGGTHAGTHGEKGRIPPVTDLKMILSWNSLAISGLARAAVAFSQPDYTTLATQVARFILANQWQENRLYRLNYGNLDGNSLDSGPRVAVLAQGEDYALWIKALLDLHQASLVLGSDPSQAQFWLAEAEKVQQEFDQELWSEDLGGYYNTSWAGSQHLVVRERSYMDGAVPATNGVAAQNLLRLFLLGDRAGYYDRAEQILQAFSGTMNQAAQTCPSLFQALDYYRNGTIVKAKPATIAALAQGYWPTVVFQVSEDLPGDALGLVCSAGTCLEPVQTLAQLQEQLQKQSSRSL